MEITIWTLLVALLMVVAGKFTIWVIGYFRMCRELRKIPQIPSHWLRGNMDKIKDFGAYLDVLASLVKENNVRMACLWFGPIPAVAVTHPETVQQLMNQNSFKGIRRVTEMLRFLIPWLGESLGMVNGEKWKRNRKLITPAFHFDILKAYVPRVSKCADAFLANVKRKSRLGEESVEVTSLLDSATLETVMKCSLSCQDDFQNPEREEHPYMKAVQELTRLFSKRTMNPFHFPDSVYFHTKDGRDFLREVGKARAFTGKLINMRQKSLEIQHGEVSTSRKPDFLDILLTARTEDGAGLTAEEIHDEVELFTFAGHDTTLSGLTWTIYCLAKYPDMQQQIYEEVNRVMGEAVDVEMDHIVRLEFSTCFIKEVLRLYSPIPWMTRAIDKPTMIDGVELPVGTRVDIAIEAIHHSPEIWPNPEEFRPARFKEDGKTDRHPFAFIPFSAGKRNCIGQNFAQIVIKVFLAKLVQRFRVRQDPGHTPVRRPQLIIVSENGVKVYVDERNKG